MFYAMADETPIVDSLASSATAPAEVSVDGMTVRERPVSDQIAADKYRRATKGFSRPGFGLGFQKGIPHGGAF